MNYKVLLAVGDKVLERTVGGVVGVSVNDGIYLMRDTTGTVVFSAPADSVVCIEQI